MKNYRKCRNYENIQKACFEGSGAYDIPIIKPTPYERCEWIGFNCAISCKEKKNKGVHFFLDDYQFTRLWTNIGRYTELLRQFKYVMSPDFSLYTDFPLAMQIYNHYRKHWIAAYWQKHGISVIPTICWGDENSYGWCFDGEPECSTVAVSSVGCMKNKENKELFLRGYREMVERLSPTQIIFYGSIPEECKGNIVRVKAFQEKFKEAACNGW